MLTLAFGSLQSKLRATSSGPDRQSSSMFQQLFVEEGEAGLNLSL